MNGTIRSLKTDYKENINGISQWDYIAWDNSIKDTVQHVLVDFNVPLSFLAYVSQSKEMDYEITAEGSTFRFKFREGKGSNRSGYSNVQGFVI